MSLLTELENFVNIFLQICRAYGAHSDSCKKSVLIRVSSVAKTMQLKSARHARQLLQNCARHANPRPRSRKQAHRRRGER